MFDLVFDKLFTRPVWTTVGLFLGCLTVSTPTPTLSETLPTACRCVVNFHNRQNTLTCLENPYSGFNQIEKRVLRLKYLKLIFLDIFP